MKHETIAVKIAAITLMLNILEARAENLVEAERKALWRPNAPQRALDVTVGKITELEAVQQRIYELAENITDEEFDGMKQPAKNTHAAALSLYISLGEKHFIKTLLGLADYIIIK